MHTHITNGFTRRLHLHPDETAFLPSSHLCRNAPSGTLFESTTQSVFPLPLFCNFNLPCSSKSCSTAKQSFALGAGPYKQQPQPHRAAPLNIRQRRAQWTRPHITTCAYVYQNHARHVHFRKPCYIP